jgi:hypothetical protein
VHLAARNLVERVFHPRGELVVHIRLEMLLEEARDDPARVGRDEAPPVQFHVLARTSVWMMLA